MTTPTQSQIRDALALLQLWRREKNMTHKSMIGVTLTEDAVLDAVEAALSQKPAGDAVREQLSAIQKRLEDAGVLDVKFAISPDGDRSKLAELIKRGMKQGYALTANP